MPAIGFDRKVARGGAGRPGAVSKTIGREFFDRQSIIKMMDQKTYSGLNRFGNLTMKDSRQNIRKRAKNKNGRGLRKSRPGQSPTYQGGGWGAMREIYYGFSKARRSVVIGPAIFPGRKSDNVPRTLEEGGMTENVRTGKSQYIAPRPYMRPAFERQLQRQASKLIDAGIFIRSL